MGEIGRHESSTSARQLAARKLEKEACELRSRGYNLETIATILDHSVAGVQKAINRSMQAAIALRDHDVTLLIELYRMRLERLLRVAMDQVIRDDHKIRDAVAEIQRQMDAGEPVAEELAAAIEVYNRAAGNVSWEAWDRSLKASQALAELEGVIQTKGVSVFASAAAGNGMTVEVGVSYKEPAQLGELRNLSFEEVVEMRRLMVKAGAADDTIPVTPLLESGSLQRVGSGTVDSSSQNGNVQKKVVRRKIVRKVAKKKP